MSDYRTTVTVRWPFAPLGVRVVVEVPETYDLDENVSAPLIDLLADLRKQTLLGRVAAFLSQPIITIKATFTNE
jgi:hypothetical protein